MVGIAASIFLQYRVLNPAADPMVGREYISRDKFRNILFLEETIETIVENIVSINRESERKSLTIPELTIGLKIRISIIRDLPRFWPDSNNVSQRYIGSLPISLTEF